MRRRDLIKTITGVALAWPLDTGAQRSDTRRVRIGIIDNGPMWDDFWKGLRDLGYVESSTIAFEYRIAEAIPSQLALAAKELAGLPVDVIVTFGTPATSAAKQATTTIPIGMIGVGDPLSTGLVASLARPGGNLTGVSNLNADLVAKRLQLFKETVPGLSRVTFFWNPDNASSAAIFAELQTAAPALGVTLVSATARSAEEIDGAIAAVIQDRPDGFQLTADPLHQLHMGRIVDLLAKDRIPGMFQVRENVVRGGLMSYGTSLPDLFRRGARYVDQILRGAVPRDLPVEQPTKFELVINMKVARALGIEILARADELIE